MLKVKKKVYFVKIFCFISVEIVYFAVLKFIYHLLFYMTLIRFKTIIDITEGSKNRVKKLEW